MDPLTTVFLALALSTGGIQEVSMQSLSGCFSAKKELGGDCVHRTYGVIKEWPPKKDTWVQSPPLPGKGPNSGQILPFYPFEAKYLVERRLGTIVDKPKAETESGT